MLYFLDTSSTFRTKALVFPSVGQLTAEYLPRNYSKFKRAASSKVKLFQGQFTSKTLSKGGCKNQAPSLKDRSRDLKRHFLLSKLLTGLPEVFGCRYFTVQLFISSSLNSLPYWCLSQWSSLINHLHTNLHL